MSRATLRRFLLVALLVLPAAVATAGPSILVDEIHGHPAASQLAARWPDCPVTALSSADFPLEQVLASGVALEDTVYHFTVPAGAEVLYGRFACGDPVQYPFISLYGPDGGRVCGHFRGHFHVEAPAPGDYALHYSSWDPQLVNWTVGVGPQVLTTERLAGHDVLVRIAENTYQLFCGLMPPYTPDDLATLDAYLASGGGSYHVRQPEVEFALKPIIDLTAPRDVVCDVSVSLPGALTYAEPPATERVRPGGTVATWSGVAVAAGQTTRLAYEGALSPPRPRLLVSGGAGGAASLRLRNRSSHPLRELHLARHLGGDRWELAAAGDLRPGADLTGLAAAEVSRAGAAAALATAIADGGARAGMTAAQLAEFQGRYRWADRVLAAATGTGRWTALFRVGTAACDALLPLAVCPAPAARSRTFWFWVTDIPAGLGPDQAWPQPDPAPALAGLGPHAGPVTVVEYGVIRQRYPDAAAPAAATPRSLTGPTPPAARDLDWLGWTFHDEVWVIDPQQNAGTPELPWLTTVGQHPDAAGLLAGLLPLGGVRCGGVVSWPERTVLRGGPDAGSEDGFFPPGSHPPVVVARDVGEGRAVAVASRELFEDTDHGPNALFMRRLLDWLAPDVSAAPGPGTAPGPAVAVAGLAAHPNPFNPRTEVVFTLDAPTPVTVTVHDAAGRRVARLLRAPLAAGPHRVAWDGRDHAGRAVAAGVYVVRVTTPAGATASCKVTLVD